MFLKCGTTAAAHFAAREKRKSIS